MKLIRAFSALILVTAACAFGFIYGDLKCGFGMGLDSFKELDEEIEEHRIKSKIK